MALSSKEVAAQIMNISVAPSESTDQGHQYGPQQQSRAAQIMDLSPRKKHRLWTDISMASSGSLDHGHQQAFQ